MARSLFSIFAFRAARDEVMRRVEKTVSVAVAGEAVLFGADSEYGRRIAHQVFAPLADVKDLATSAVAEPAGRWRVFTGRVDSLCDLEKELAQALAAGEGCGEATVRRWKGDDPALRLDFPGGHAVVVHEKPFRGLTLFDPIESTIFYLRDDSKTNVPHTEHTIKYPLRVLLRENGACHAHAASCSYRGAGMLLLGFRKSGKSTLLMRLLAEGADFVANDLSFVRLSKDGVLRLLAVPHMTRLAPGTIGDNEMLRSALDGEPRGDDYLESAIYNDGKEELYYPVFRRMVQRDCARRQAELDLILLPKLDLSRRDSAVRRLTSEEGRQVVFDRLVNDPPLPEWLPFFPDERLEELTRKHASDLVERLPPVFELDFGDARTDPVGAVDHILDEMWQGTA